MRECPVVSLKSLANRSPNDGIKDAFANYVLLGLEE